MTCTTRTKGFKLQQGVVNCVGLTPTTAEKWGGGTYPTVDKIYLTEDVTVPSETPEYYENIDSTGDASKDRDHLVAIPTEGTITTKVYPESAGIFLYTAMGYADLSGPHTDGSLQAHLFEIDGNGLEQCEYTTAEAALATANGALSPAYNSGDIKNRDFTRLIEMGPADYKQANCRVTGLTISGNSKEPLKFEISFVSEVVEKDGTKTESASWTLTQDDFATPIQLRHTTSFEVEGTEFGIFDFSYALTWDADTDRFPTGTSGSGLNRDEPMTNSCAVELNFTIDRHDSTVWEGYRNSDTTIAIKHELTLGSTGFLGFYFPEVQVKTVEIDPTGGSRLAITAVANHCIGADPFATERTFGVTTVARVNSTPMYVILKNSKTANEMRKA